ncbi:MAG TPA: YceI family protein [Candidatus Micrarchaeia archaeon]|nr:YceI family protein [Candidatus Micrarchaeia archaeon]
MTWQIDKAHTDVSFSVRHMMVSTVRGHFKGVDGELDFDPADLTTARLRVTIPVASIDTREERRDGHLRSADFFDVEHYPSITYVSREVRAEGGDRYRVVGDLTIRDQTRPVDLEVTLGGVQAAPMGGRSAGFEALAKISRKDFGLNWNVALESGGVLVGDEVKITIDAEVAEVVPAAAGAAAG